MRLRFESIDDDPEEVDFPSLDEAIKGAIEWFRSGYENDTIDEATRAEARAEEEEIAVALRSGNAFHCGRFHEHIEII